MANYKEIQGFNIQSKSSDPVPFAQAKEDSPWAGVWASGGNLNTDRWGLSGAGIQTAAIAIDGLNPNVTDVVETYNGTSWTEVTENNTGRNDAAAGGTSTATIFFGGYTGTAASADAESWNGSAWTEGTNLNTARFELGGAGQTNTAVLAFGGTDPSIPGRVGSTEKWNGTSWTESGDLSVATKHIDGTGTSTAAVAIGGNIPPNGVTADVETFNGSAWSEIAEMNTARFQSGNSGTTTSALTFGGMTAATTSTANTESYDGSSWTEVNNLASARGYAGSISGSSVTASALFGGTSDGGTPNDTAATEEWNFPGPTSSALVEGQMWFNSSSSLLKVYGQSVPTGTWATGTNLNTSRQEGSTSGIQTASIVGGGYTTTYVANTETYDGTSWTEVSDMNAARGGMAPSVRGSTTATFAAGGAPNPSPPTSNNVEFWNTSSWTEGTNMNTARSNGAGAGTQTSGLVYMGYYPTYQTNTETWDGTSWTEVSDLNNAGYGSACIGTQTAALATGRAGNPTKAKVEEWNGTSWTNKTDQNTGRFGTGGAGLNTDALMFAGNENPGSSAKTEHWDGTSWTELADLGTGSPAYQAGCGASAGLALRTNGDPTPTNLVEEWTADNGILTVTTS